MIQVSSPALSFFCIGRQTSLHSHQTKKHESGTYDSDGVFADILEPNELESAGSVTVHTFSLVLSNDDVLQLCASAKQKYGIGITCRPL